MATARGTFTATGQSPTVYGHIIEAIVGGTFVATMALEVAIADATGADTWVSIATASAPGMLVVPSGAIMSTSRKARLNCTAYTSGTTSYQLSGSLFDDITEQF